MGSYSSPGIPTDPTFQGTATFTGPVVAQSTVAASGAVSGQTLSAGSPSGTSTLSGHLTVNGNTKLGNATGDTLGFYDATAVAKQTVTGAKGSNAALGSLMTALAALGLVVDSTTA